MRNKYYNIILSSGLYSIFKCWRKYEYYSIYNDDIPIDIMPYESFIYYVNKYQRLYSKFINMYTARARKVQRVKKRITNMLFNREGEFQDCLFLTLTFSPDVIASTTQKTRRVYVSRYLKSQYDKYVANIDFGDLHNTEHYHAVVGANFVDLESWYSNYGIINVEHIRNNFDKIAQYINKLTYHSVKDTAGYLIYSKKF